MPDVPPCCLTPCKEIVRGVPVDDGAARSFCAPTQLSSAVDTAWPTLNAEYDLATYHQAFLRTERMVAGYIVLAFEQLGLRFVPGTRLTVSQQAAELGVIPRVRAAVDTSLRNSCRRWCPSP